MAVLTDPRTKKRLRYRQAGFTTKGAAVSALAKLRASLDAGTLTEPSKKTLAQYAPEALERRCVTGAGLKASTEAAYRRAEVRPQRTSCRPASGR